jgi:hypothetical protein
MKYELFLLINLCIACLRGTSQSVTPISVFHEHTQACHFTGTSEKDEVLELFNDSTIKISLYQSDFSGEYNSVVRNVYTGRFSRSSDTLFIVYTNNSTDVKSRKTAKFPLPVNKVDGNIVFYPAATILISDEKVTGLDKPLTLNRSSAGKADQLNSLFKLWDKGASNSVFGLD